jgi:hypothetical protein
MSATAKMLGRILDLSSAALIANKLRFIYTRYCALHNTSRETAENGKADLK